MWGSSVIILFLSTITKGWGYASSDSFEAEAKQRLMRKPPRVESSPTPRCSKQKRRYRIPTQSSKRYCQRPEVDK